MSILSFYFSVPDSRNSFSELFSERFSENTNHLTLSKSLKDSSVLVAIIAIHNRIMAYRCEAVNSKCCQSVFVNFVSGEDENVSEIRASHTLCSTLVNETLNRFQFFMFMVSFFVHFCRSLEFRE